MKRTSKVIEDTKNKEVEEVEIKSTPAADAIEPIADIVEVEVQVEVEVPIEKPAIAAKQEEVPTQVKIRWRNDGGTLRFRKNQIIKPGEKFSAYPDEIPKAFRDVIIALEPIQEGPIRPEIPTNVVMPVYKMEPAEKEGFFDIYNGNGKKMNESPLEAEIATQLIKDLQG